MELVAVLFGERSRARAIHDAVQAAVDKIGPAEVRATKSQVGFYRNHPFAATWIPSQYLKRELAPLVLTVYLKRRDNSERWKQIVEPTKGRFTHHVELSEPNDVDEFIRRRLADAWADAA